MGEAQEMYEHAMNETGIDDPAEALDALIASYGRDEYEYEYDLDNEEYDEVEDDLEILKTRLVEIEISLKKLNDEKENILSELMALDNDEDMESNMNYEKNNNIVQKIDIKEDEIPF